jgi:hypothetical protein
MKIKQSGLAGWSPAAEFQQSFENIEGYKGLEEAIEIVSSLPTQRGEGTIYSYPDVSSHSNKDAWFNASKQLQEHVEQCEEKATLLVEFWASDAAVGAGELKLGLELFPAPPPSRRRSLQASNIMSLKYELSERLSARDLMALFGPTLTKFGLENAKDIENFLQIKMGALKDFQERNLLEEWILDAHEVEHGYSLFNGHPSYIMTKPPRGLSFELSNKSENFATEIIKEAENTFREEMNLPKIGEGWISETILYYALKGLFSTTRVEQHARPQWLGRQHLDVYLSHPAR